MANRWAETCSSFAIDATIYVANKFVAVFWLTYHFTIYIYIYIYICVCVCVCVRVCVCLYFYVRRTERNENFAPHKYNFSPQNIYEA